MTSGVPGSNFLLVPIPEYPLLDCVPNRTVKLVVLGASGVGKTALIVRFLTKRFIGDYEPNTGALYSRTLDSEDLSLQIQDTPCVSLQGPILYTEQSSCPSAEEKPQTIMFPPPCLTVGMVSVKSVKTAILKHSPYNLTELELFCKGEWTILLVSRSP